MATKKAAGGGSIRKKVVRKNGKEYVYWEARATVGINIATGKPISRSITAKTQKQCRQLLAEIVQSVDNGTYQEPLKLTVGGWVQEWIEVYAANSVKDYTLSTYRQVLKNHIQPGLGAMKLQDLRGNHVQRFYNDLTNRKGLTGKTVKNIASVLHHALDRAVKLGYIATNPCNAADLPKVKNVEFQPLTDAEIPLFLKALDRSTACNAMAVCLLCGLREGELLGLSWDRVDFERKQITVAQQLQRSKEKGGGYRLLDSTKSGKPRTIQPPAIAFEYLLAERKSQAGRRLKAGMAWENEWNLCFTNATGKHLALYTFYKRFKAIAAEIGRPELRPHDLRHTAATVAIAAGADIKSVQQFMGHATAAFTLDKYAHISEKMKEDTAARLQDYYSTVTA